MQDIHDIKGAIEILPFWREHLTILLILAAIFLLGILALLIWFIKRKIINNSTKSNLPRLSPYEQAVLDLKNAQEFMKPGFDKVLSTKSSDVIRRYIEEAFHIRSSKKTTEEFLHNIQGEQVFNGKLLDTLVAFLEMSDLAKFAKIEFTYNEQKMLLEKANMFLDLAHNEEIRILEEAKKEEGIQTV